MSKYKVMGVIRVLTDNYNVTCDVLDDTVHCVSSRIATTVNNSGASRQAQYLMDNGYTVE